MADLTDSQEKDYTRQITAMLAEYAAEMVAKDVDPAKRIAALRAGAEETDRLEALQAKAQAAAVAATEATTQARTDNYNLAQASVGLLEGALGKSHPASEKARSIRSEMTNAAARGPRPPATAPAKPADT